MCACDVASSAMATGPPRDEVQRLWEQYYADEEGYLRRDDPESYAATVLDGRRPFEGQVDLAQPRTGRENPDRRVADFIGWYPP
jgi:hypothetical protein